MISYTKSPHIKTWPYIYDNRLLLLLVKLNLKFKLSSFRNNALHIELKLMVKNYTLIFYNESRKLALSKWNLYEYFSNQTC